MNDNLYSPPNPQAENVKHGLWMLGASSWVLGMTDRSVASIMDGSLSGWDLGQLALMSLLLAGWWVMKPLSLKLLPSKF